MGVLASWLSSVVARLPFVAPPTDPSRFGEREAELKRRLERLTREVEVVQRAQIREDQQP